MIEERKRIVANTLKWCNERRKDNGLKPLDDLPKGTRWDGTSCPCGKACGFYVGYRTYQKVIPGYTSEDYSEDDGIGDLPSDVVLFAKEFDAKHFPEYDLDPTFRHACK